MTTSFNSRLAKEALVEAKQLRQLAENNAKNALLEHLTPKLKVLIEKQLLGEGVDDDEDILVDAGPDNPMDVPSPALGLDPQMPAGDVQQLDVAAGEPAGITLPDEEGKITVDIDALAADDEVELTAESVGALAKLAGAKAERFGVQTLRISKKVDVLKEQKGDTDVVKSEKLKQVKVEIESMWKDLQESKIPDETKTIIEENLEDLYKCVNTMYAPVKVRVVAKGYNKIVRKTRKLKEVANSHNFTDKAKRVFGFECVSMIKEALVLHSTLADLYSVTGDKKVGVFADKISTLCKEIYNMANKRGKLNEGDLRLILRGLPDEVDVESLTVDAEPAPMDDMGGEEELGLDLGVGDEGGDDLGGELEMPDLEEMDVALDVDLPDDIEIEPEDVAADVSALDDEGAGDDAGFDGAAGGEEELDMDDEVVEISESMLRKELKRLRARRLNETDHDVGDSPKEFDGTAHGPEMEDQFGGGTGTGEPFVDRDDSDLNTLGESELSLEAELAELDELDESDELDEEEMPMDEMEEPPMEESKTRFNRALSEKVKSYKSATDKLKKQLVEAQKQLKDANLFNAKLVYANKLLSNENLSQKQKVTIVNALEGAESIKEVKKLYAHLNEALSGKKVGKDKLTESRRVLGGGSRAQKSGAASSTGLNETEKKEFGRWGELAGILGD